MRGSIEHAHRCLGGPKVPIVDRGSTRSDGIGLVACEELLEKGLVLLNRASVTGGLVYERPAFVHDPHRIKDCAIGAFTLINGQNKTSLYRCFIGRYGQIAESVVLGPPEHPIHWFSSHPFAFTRPHELPKMYQLEDFARLAPDGTERGHYVESVPGETWIGHEAYIGASSVVRRGMRIGDGAVIGAGSVVTHDIPPYAVAVGTPARVIRMRFPDAIVERLLALQWWRYDLAPYKHAVDFSRVEETLEFFEQRKADGRLIEYRPDTWRITPKGTGFEIQAMDGPLYFP